MFTSPIEFFIYFFPFWFVKLMGYLALFSLFLLDKMTKAIIIHLFKVKIFQLHTIFGRSIRIYLPFINLFIPSDTNIVPKKVTKKCFVLITLTVVSVVFLFLPRNVKRDGLKDKQYCKAKITKNSDMYESQGCNFLVWRNINENTGDLEKLHQK